MSEDLYFKLASTAKSFIESTNASTTHAANNPNHDLLRSHAAPDFRIHWAPKLFAQTCPLLLRDAKDIDGFCAHIKTMSAIMSTCAISVQDVFVDVRKRTAVVRAEFRIVPRGAEDGIVNDIVFFMRMDESGGKVVDCTEYVDPEASRIIWKSITGNTWGLEG